MARLQFRPQTQNPVRVLLVVASGLLAAFSLVWYFQTPPGDDLDGEPRASVSARDAERGFTKVPTVAVDQSGAGFAATPRPAVLPPMIEAPAQCKAELDVVRDLMDASPYGLDAGPKTLKALTAALTALRDSHACSTDVLHAFNRQEVYPWSTWTSVPQDPSE